MKKDRKTYLDIAILAAKRAGKVHRKYFEKKFRITTKGKPFDLLTTADIQAEKIIIDTIKRSFPEHNFLAEENHYKKTSSEYTWIIDPLDGTNNFSSGMPIFCSSVALSKGKEVILGAIYDVSKDELFCAVKGKGSYLNGKRIRVARSKNLKESLLITGFYYDRGKDMRETLNKIEIFFKKPIRGLRRLGAAALDLCYIACGRAAGFWEFKLSPWDFAAGNLLVKEAGGEVTDRFGKKVPLESSFVVASNGKIHSAMLSVLRKH